MCYAEKELSRNILHAMYVLPEFQGKGIGTKLWKNIVDFFDPKKYIFLHAFESNNTAINFYNKLGFIDSRKRINEDRFTSQSGITISEIEMIFPKY